MLSTVRLALLIMCSLIGSGCRQAVKSEGTEAAARAFFTAEFDKWLVGEKTQAETWDYNRGLSPPISYDIRSVVADKPDFLDFSSEYEDGLPKDWRQWPTYRFNVAIEWMSEARTPLVKVTSYRLTWSPDKRKWYLENLWF